MLYILYIIFPVYIKFQTYKSKQQFYLNIYKENGKTTNKNKTKIHDMVTFKKKKVVEINKKYN